ncbi:MAG: hypothetical protein QM756_21305 [Polyangiaceae bacterium]
MPNQEASAAPSAVNAPAKCNGTPPEGLREQITVRARTAQECYQALLLREVKAAKATPSRGRVHVLVQLEAGGKLSGAKLESSELGDAEFESCVLSKFQQALPVDFASDCIDISIPLRFEPTPADNPAAAGASQKN